MIDRIFRHGLALLAGCATLLPLAAAAAPSPSSSTARPAVAGCSDDAGWDDPAEPFRIYANAWYVGTCGISAVLITSPKGDILFDAGTDHAPALVEANIRRLGFRIADVRYILNSHAHNDHAGGLAQLQRDSGARVVARGADADAIERGHGDRSDPQFLSSKPFPPVAHVRRITDGETLLLGDIAITAHATPGHTAGSTSWTWDASEGARRLHMVYADSLTAISDHAWRYGDDAAHPGAVTRFRASIATVAALPCDILLTPHPGASNMWSRFGPRATPSTPVIDPTLCRRYGQHAAAVLDKRLADEAAKK